MQSTLFAQEGEAPAGRGRVKVARYHWSDKDEVAKGERDAQDLFGSNARILVESFGSGCSAKWDMLGYMLVGENLGVTATELLIDERVTRLRRFVEHGGRVFVDSGAFGAFQAGRALDFEKKVFPLYDALLEDCLRPDGFMLVMPDVVGSAEKTAELQALHLARIVKWMRAGAECIFPIQSPNGDTVAEYERLVRMVGTDRFTVGIPSNAHAWSAKQTVEFAHKTMPARMHLLGLAHKASVRKIAHAIASKSPGTQLSCDSCSITAHAGVGRRLTDRTRGRLRDAVRYCADGAWFEHESLDIPDLSTYLTDVLYEPDFVGEEHAVQMARALGRHGPEQEGAFKAAIGEGMATVLCQLDHDEQWMHAWLSDFVLEHIYGPMVEKRLRGPIRAWELARLAAGRDPDDVLAEHGRLPKVGVSNAGTDAALESLLVEWRNADPDRTTAVLAA